MTSLKIGELVANQGRIQYERGFSPLRISPRRLQLEDATSGQTVAISEARASRSAGSAAASARTMSARAAIGRRHG